MATCGRIIDDAIRFYVNQGSTSGLEDVKTRDRARFFLRKVGKRVWNAAPWWWKYAMANVALTSGEGTAPADFGHFGQQGGVYLQNIRYRQLGYVPPYQMANLLQNQPQNGQPYCYTLNGRTTAGLPKVLCWPTDNSTLVFWNYVKNTPPLIDKPTAAALATGSATGLTGTYTGKVTFVTASGETEGGIASVSASPSNQKLNWTGVPLAPYPEVTSRKLYRPANGGVQYKLAQTIADNLTTTFTGDNTADGALGADIPDESDATSGLEQFPPDFHESVIYDGLVYLLMKSQGDDREVMMTAEWDKAVKNMWAELKQGQNQVNAFPPYPGFTEGHPVWGQFSPPTS